MKYLAFLLTAALCANDLQNHINATLANEPSTLIEGQVSAITGAYFIHATDAHLPAREPLSLTRTYVSLNQKLKEPSWEFFPHIRYTKEGNAVIIKEPDGTVVVYSYGLFNPDEQARISTQPFPRYLPEPPMPELPHYKYTTHLPKKHAKPILGKGFCHTGSHTLANNTLEDRPDEAILYVADGTIRHYTKNHVKQHTLLTKEVRPSGTTLHYHYNSESVNPVRITLKSPSGKKTYLDIYIEYVNWQKPGQKIRLYRSYPWKKKIPRKLLVEYSYDVDTDAKKPCFYLNQITSRQNPTEFLTYLTQNDTRYSLVASRAHGAHPPTQITYKGSEKNLYSSAEVITLPTSSTYTLERQATWYDDARDSKTLQPKSFYTYTATVTDPLGNRTVYESNTDKRLTRILRYRGDLLYYKQCYNWSDKGDLLSKCIYNNDKPCLTTTYTYDENHNKLSETIEGDFTGSGEKTSQTTRYTYEKQKHYYLLASETLPTGKKTVYTYQGDTNLPATIETYWDGALQISETFKYDDENVLIEHTTISDGYHKRRVITPKMVFPAAHQPASIATYTRDTLLSRVDYAYNNDNLVTREDHYDANNNCAYSLHTTYDESFRPISKTDPLGRVTKTSYDANNNPHTVTSDSAPYTLQTTYDPQNRPLTTSRDEYKETLTYDPLGRPHIATNHRGHKTTHTYDKNALQTTTTQHTATTTTTYDSLGRPIAVTDPDGHTTTTTYNALGQPVRITYPDGAIETKLYTPSGHLASHTLPNNTTTLYTYDAIGRPLTKKTYGRSNAPLTTETYDYNALHLIRYTNPLGTTTTHTYDTAGRKTATRTHNAHTAYAYDPLSRLYQTTTYTSPTNARVETHTFDNASRLIQKTETDLTGKLYSKTTYTYDPYDNLLTETSHDQKTTYTYDKFSRPTSTTNAHDQKTTTTYIDTPTLKTRHTDRKGRILTTTYDPLERPILTEMHHNHTLLARHRYTYTPAGDKTDAHITAIRPDNSQHTIHRRWTYNSRHLPTAFTDADTQTTHYTYTPTLQLATRIKPDGTTILHTYDPLDRLIRLQAPDIDYTFTYNALHLIAATDNHTQTTTTRYYDPLGNITREILANKLAISRTFDLTSRPTTLTYPDHTSTHYTYDAYHLKTIQRKTFTYNYFYDSLHRVTHTSDTAYSYDRLSRPLSTTSPHHKDALTYDATDNPTTRTLNNQTLHYSYDAYDHLTAEPSHTYTYDSLHNRHTTDQATHTINALNQDTSHTYDANGNPTSSPSHTYTYDSLDRLTSIDDTRLTYDPFNRLIYIDDDAILYDNDLDIGTYRNNAPLNLRILGNTPSAEIGAAVLVELDRTYRPYHDLFGNVILLDRPYSYTAYGTTHDSPNPWQYQSKRTIGHLIYFSNRFYDPTLGRFLTPDPLGYVDAPNLYHYALSSPLSHHDPWGLTIDMRSPDYWNNWIESYRHNIETFSPPKQLSEYPIGPATDPPYATYNPKTTLHPRMRDRIDHDPNMGYIQGKDSSRFMPFFSSGLRTPYSETKAGAQKIFDSYGGKYTVIFGCSSKKNLISDLWQAGKLGFGIEDDLSRSYGKIIRSACERGIYSFHHNHSKGTAKFDVATKNLSQKYTQMFTIDSYGAESFVPQDRGRFVMNHKITNDPIPHIFNPIQASGTSGANNHGNHYPVNMLAPHTKNPFKEHLLWAPVYRGELYRNINQNLDRIDQWRYGIRP